MIKVTEMVKEIRSYWQSLKTQYIDRYGEPFLDDYDHSIEYFKKLENYLLKKKEEHPLDLDVLLNLASAKMELRKDDESVEMLENFLRENSTLLSDDEKSRIYTDLAFYYDEKRLEYLKLASDLNSPYADTYKALGIYYFSEYQYNHSKENLHRSTEYFKLAREMDSGYKHAFNYAVCLYEEGNYIRAAEIFRELLKKHPNRMRLLLSLSYCEAYLENIDRAKSYLERVKIGMDANYHLSSDEINDYEIYDLYYVLGDYDKFLECWGKENIEEYYTLDWEHYFYTLWLKGKKDLFSKLVEKNISYLDMIIAEATEDEYDSEEEKKITLVELKQEKQEFEEMILRIQNSNETPKLKLSLEPEMNCFLIDCIRHKLL